MTRPRSRRTSISGVAPNMPSTWKVQHMGYVAARRCSGQRTSIGCVGGGDQVAGEHDLLEVAGADPRDRVGDDGHPLLAVEGAVGEAHRPGRRRRATGAAAASGSVTSPIGGQPGAVAAAADDDPRQHQHRLAGLVGEREASRSRPGRCRARRPRRARSVRAMVSDHHFAASEKRVGPDVRIIGGDAPADQALAPAQPGDGGVGGQQVDQLTAAGGPAPRSGRRGSPRRWRRWSRGKSVRRGLATTDSGGQLQ